MCALSLQLVQFERRNCHVVPRWHGTCDEIGFGVTRSVERFGLTEEHIFSR